MQVKPWFSREVGKDSRKRENGGGKYYHVMGKGVKITSSQWLWYIKIFAYDGFSHQLE